MGLMMANEPYADIHQFLPGNECGLVDDDGDELNGWYFQFMSSPETALGAITGPYGSRPECEKAALREWATL